MTPEERRATIAKTIEAEVRKRLRPRFRTLRSLDELTAVRAEANVIALEVLRHLGGRDLEPIRVEIDDPIPTGQPKAGHCTIRYVGAPWGDLVLDLDD